MLSSVLFFLRIDIFPHPMLKWLHIPFPQEVPMFSPDSKFMIVVSRFADLLLLNLVFLLTCLPVFTIGASLTALYTMCFRLMREEYSGIIRSYFSAFRANFKQATVIWLILLVAGVPAVYYLTRLLALEGILRYAGFLFVLIQLVVMMAGSYVFPWISQFENATGQALKNALILSISHLPRTLAIVIINLVPAIVWFFSPELFIQVSFLWVALYGAAAAYMNTGLLWHVFKPYRNA